MKSVYGLLIETAKNRGSWSINLKKRNLKIGGKYYIKEGEAKTKLPIINGDELEIEGNIYEILEMLYENYKNSYPDKKERRKEWFKREKIDEEDKIKYLKNESQELAQAKLEGLVMLSKEIEIENWFYQGKDKDFIILKNWIR